MSRAKHDFMATGRDISYESAPTPKGEMFDPSLPTTTFKIQFLCTRCGIEATVVREAQSYFKQALLGDFDHIPKPNALELRHTPNCKKWQTIRAVMES
jgi:hypothetical protein